MSFTLLFDSHCPQCTTVARRIHDLGIADLAVASLTDPAVRETLAGAGHEVPTRPALMQVGAGGVTVWTGLALRWRLARLVGLRHSGRLVGLVRLESSARMGRARPGGVNRRRVLGGAIAAAGAAVVGAALPASAATAPPARPATAAERRRVLASPTVHDASRRWGAPDAGAIMVATTEDGEAVALVSHQGSGAVSVVGLAHLAEPGITLAGSAETKAIQFHLTSGEALADLVVAGERVDVRPSAAAAPGTVQPASFRRFVACFIRCLHAQVSFDCATNCLNCYLFHSVFACVPCAICAGPRAYRCFKQCRSVL